MNKNWSNMAGGTSYDSGNCKESTENSTGLVTSIDFWDIELVPLLEQNTPVCKKRKKKLKKSDLNPAHYHFCCNCLLL